MALDLIELLLEAVDFLLHILDRCRYTVFQVFKLLLPFVYLGFYAIDDSLDVSLERVELRLCIICELSYPVADCMIMNEIISAMKLFFAKGMLFKKPGIRKSGGFIML